jgi:hypothetical protein
MSSVLCCAVRRLLKGMDVPDALQLAAGGPVQRSRLLYLLDRWGLRLASSERSSLQLGGGKLMPQSGTPKK